MRLPVDLRLGRFALAWILLAFPAGFAGAAEPESADLRYFRELVETRNYSLGQPVSPEIHAGWKSSHFPAGRRARSGAPPL